MFHPTPHFSRNYRNVGLALALAVTVTIATYLLTHTHPLPVVPEQSAPVVSMPVVSEWFSYDKIDPGAGYSWEGGELVAPAMVMKPVPQKLDIGGGYTLKLNGAYGEVVAPARPSTHAQRIEMGSGYVLQINGDSGRIYQTTAPVIIQPDMTVIQTVDLGGGYELQMTATGGQIVAGSASALAGMQMEPAVIRTDLGGGYWLEVGPDGGQIIKR